VEETEVQPVLRFFGAKSNSEFRALQNRGGRSDAEVNIVPFSKQGSDRYRPTAIVAGDPLIEPRGIVRGRDFAYVADAGRDGKRQGPATIWRIKPSDGKIDVFYRGGLLVNSNGFSICRPWTAQTTK
jgi:hypothetical protein